MNSEKLVSYEISSDEESDKQEEAQDHDTAGTKRSYDCTFCKRGFTNAQALGGHMNIHRKDRAKAKQVTTPNSSLQNPNEEEFMALPFSSEFSNQPTRHCTLESQRNCDMYFHPPPAPNYSRNQPSPPYAHAFQHEFHHNPRSQPMNFNQELRGANLSLQIGPSHVDNANQVRRGTQEDSEVDLELRLGHDPCWKRLYHFN